VVNKVVRKTGKETLLRRVEVAEQNFTKKGSRIVATEQRGEKKKSAREVVAG